MRRTYLRIAAAVFAFSLGVSVNTVWSRFQWHSSKSAVGPALSPDEEWHRFYEAVGMSGDAAMFTGVRNRLLCANRAGVADAWPIEIDGRSCCQKADKTIHELRLNGTSEYGSFSWRITTSHRSWTLQNLDFVRSIGTAKSAREYVFSHRWPSDR